MQSAVLALMLWPALVQPVYPTEISLDASWQSVLVRAHTQGWQFGRDLIFTWGPWGFLQSQYHLGAESSLPKLIWETAGKLLVAFGVVALTQRLAVWRQIFFCALVFAFAWLFLDSIYMVCIVLAVVGALLQPTTPRRQLVLWLAALAFLSQLKFTYNVLAVGGVLCAAGADVLRRDYRRAALLTGGYGLAFVLLWLAAGQNPDNLLPYLRLSWNISQAYGDAMAVDESWPVFGCGASLMVAVAVFVWRLSRDRTDQPFTLAAAAFLAGAWFIVWKSAFTRADGHVNGLFVFTLLLAPTIPALCRPGRRWHWFGLTPLVCLLGIHFADSGLPLRCPAIAWDREVVLTNWLRHAGEARAAWAKAFATARATQPLPTIARLIGSSSVDVFNYEQAAALLQGLNYTPRPVFQSYVAFSPRLEGHNLRFFQSARAPDYVLWKHTSIDGRFPTIDDAVVLSELSRAYRPERAEGEVLLLRKMAPLPARRYETQFLQSFTPALGEAVLLPTTRDQAVWLNVEFSLSRLGRLRALLYKPPVMRAVVTTEDGREINYRMVPPVAKDGFLIAPFLETQEDFAAFMRSHSRQWLRSIRFEPEPGHEEFWGRQANVNLFALPELKLSSDAPIRQLIGEGVTDVNLVALRTSMPLEFFAIEAGRAALLHANSELVFHVPLDATQFSGRFGLRVGSYDHGGQTNGVDFVISGRWPDGHTAMLWHRNLNPLHVAADRETQSVSVTLPADRPAELVVSTLAGPDNDTAWDWSYWSHLRFGSLSAP